ncbi:unnamed protein product [Nesidiocoris tenuis]|uniref:Uncharacterized protein n=1 Tax=Nesidiocoris tenuis TaxID=355587 RepID=A0A6H5GTW1_9HEMI|nr:unnamed protein product [Nesidiocoris tenuis]
MDNTTTIRNIFGLRIHIISTELQLCTLKSVRTPSAVSFGAGFVQKTWTIVVDNMDDDWTNGDRRFSYTFYGGFANWNLLRSAWHASLLRSIQHNLS